MHATAIARPNIALIKYWGKADVARNLPATGSLSLTLDSLQTTMAVNLNDGRDDDRLSVNGEPAPQMLPRISACLDELLGKDRPAASVISDCNFPIAAGLASSASSFAALVLAATAAAGMATDRLSLARAAGRASGSAARSLYGGVVELSRDENDIVVDQLLAPGDWPLEVIVAVTSEKKKPLSSGAAMQQSAATSPFYATWVDRQADDLETARAAVADRDFAALANIAEHNCLKMHSVMWTSRPATVYWNTATIACLHGVRQLQADNVDVFFTIDAGPQVKAICAPACADDVVDHLAATPGVVRVLRSGLGAGAQLTETV